MIKVLCQLFYISAFLLVYIAPEKLQLTQFLGVNIFHKSLLVYFDKHRSSRRAICRRYFSVSNDKNLSELNRFGNAVFKMKFV